MEIVLNLSTPMAEQEAELRELIMSDEANMQPEIIGAPPLSNTIEQPSEPGVTGGLAW